MRTTPLLILLTAVFIILRILPGDPILALWGGRTPPQSAIDAVSFSAALSSGVNHTSRLLASSR